MAAAGNNLIQIRHFSMHSLNTTLNLGNINNGRRRRGRRLQALVLYSSLGLYEMQALEHVDLHLEGNRETNREQKPPVTSLFEPHEGPFPLTPDLLTDRVPALLYHIQERA